MTKYRFLRTRLGVHHSNNYIKRSKLFWNYERYLKNNKKQFNKHVQRLRYFWWKEIASRLGCQQRPSTCEPLKKLWRGHVAIKNIRRGTRRVLNSLIAIPNYPIISANVIKYLIFVKYMLIPQCGYLPDCRILQQLWQS